MRFHSFLIKYGEIGIKGDVYKRQEEILTSKSVIEDPKEAAEFQKSEKGVLKRCV